MCLTQLFDTVHCHWNFSRIFFILLFHQSLCHERERSGVPESRESDRQVHMSRSALGWALCLQLVILAMSQAPTQPLDPAWPFPNGRRPVYLFQTFISVQEINSVAQDFSADFYLSLLYQDPAVTGDTLPDPSNYTHINVEFLNSLDTQSKYVTETVLREAPSFLRQGAWDLYELKGLPWIFFDSRWQGSFRCSLKFEDFPFDSQSLQLAVESANQNASYCTFVQTGLVQSSSVSWPTGWSFKDIQQSVADNYYMTYSESYSRAIISTSFVRDGRFFVNKVVVGIVILTLQGFFVAALPVNDANRLGISLTVFLGIVTYLFVVTSTVPMLPVTTRLDAFIQYSMMLAFFNFMYHVVRIVQKERCERSTSANHNKYAKDHRKNDLCSIDNSGGGETASDMVHDMTGGGEIHHSRCEGTTASTPESIPADTYVVVLDQFLQSRKLDIAWCFLIVCSYAAGMTYAALLTGALRIEGVAGVTVAIFALFAFASLLKASVRLSAKQKYK